MTQEVVVPRFTFPPVAFPRPTVDLIGAMETQSEQSELELDDVVITNPHIEAILENEDWIEDASYVVYTVQRRGGNDGKFRSFRI